MADAISTVTQVFSFITSNDVLKTIIWVAAFGIVASVIMGLFFRR